MPASSSRRTVDPRALAYLREFGITPDMLQSRGLLPYREARRLQPVGLGSDGRDKLLTPPAARAWFALREAAAQDGITLQLISAFRSIEFQAALIRAKLARGQPLDAVLRINAPPGYSEHHGGCAIDLGVADIAALDEAFEQTPAYAWLDARAAHFGFYLSYPRGNAQGYAHEPWHWCWHRDR